MPPKDKNKGKSKDKNSVQNKSKGRAALSKPRARRTSKKTKSVSRAPFIFVIILLLAVIAFLLLRKTDNVKSPVAMDKRSVSVEKTNMTPEKSAKTDEVSKKSNVQVWFLRLDEKTENVSLVPVNRSVLDDGKIENTLKALIEGPSAGERARGYLTAVPPNLKIKNITIKDRVAEIYFNAAIGEAAAGNILMNRIDQIIYTATQFKEVDGIAISINGKKQSVIGSDGLSIQGILRRK